MSRFFLRKNYVDPFEEEYVSHYEVVELLRVYYYSKRTASAPYEAEYVVHSFNLIGQNVLVNSNLTIFEYLELLRDKPKEIQEKFKYKKTEVLNIHQWSNQAIFQDLGIEANYKENKESYDNILKQHILSPY